MSEKLKKTRKYLVHDVVEKETSFLSSRSSLESTWYCLPTPYLITNGPLINCISGFHGKEEFYINIKLMMDTTFTNSQMDNV